MNYFQSLYTLVEIAINQNIENISQLKSYLTKKDVDSICFKYPELKKFIPYCKWYVIQRKKYVSNVSLYL